MGVVEGSIGCDARDQLQSPVAQGTSSTETMTMFEHRCLGHLWQQALSQFFEDWVGSRRKYSHCLIYLEVVTCKMLNEHDGYCQVPTLYPFIEYVLKESFIWSFVSRSHSLPLFVNAVRFPMLLRYRLYHHVKRCAPGTCHLWLALDD